MLAIIILGVPYNTIMKIESGEDPNPTIDMLERTAKALSVSIEKLFNEWNHERKTY